MPKQRALPLAARPSGSASPRHVSLCARLRLPGVTVVRGATAGAQPDGATAVHTSTPGAGLDLVSRGRDNCMARAAWVAKPARDASAVAPGHKSVPPLPLHQAVQLGPGHTLCARPSRWACGADLPLAPQSPRLQSGDGDRRLPSQRQNQCLQHAWRPPEDTQVLQLTAFREIAVSVQQAAGFL